MLYVKGYVLTCKSREYDRKDGSGKFRSHRSLIYDQKSEEDPIAVDTGEIPLEVGKSYRVPVYASLYEPKGGRPMIQYRTLKDHPPEQIAPK